MNLSGPNPSGLCLCGCGYKAPISTSTNLKYGRVKGTPSKFIRGHVCRTHGPGFPPGINALYDSEDEALVQSCSWKVCDGYLRGYIDKRHQAFHRLIMGSPKGLEIDHINGNRLDNRRVNLRIVTRDENRQNRTRINSNTGYRNVYLRPEGDYSVQIRKGGKQYYLGRYRHLEEADKIARAWRLENMPGAVA